MMPAMGFLARAQGIVVVVGAVAACAAPEARGGPPAGQLWPSEVVVTFDSALGGGFQLAQVRARLDGEIVVECDAGEGALETASPMLVHEGQVPAGEHVLEVELRYRGHGHGVFSYLRGYSFDVRGEHTFVARREGPARVHVHAFEQGDTTTPLEDRPALRFTADSPEGPTSPGCPGVVPSDS